MSLVDNFFKGLSLYLEARTRICIKVIGRIRIRIKSDKLDPDPDQSDKQDPVSDPDPH
jgi:hypothetical protein